MTDQILKSKVLEISGIVIVRCQLLDFINFQIYLSFLIKLFSYMIKDSEQVSQKEKDLVTGNKKYFSSFLKEFQWLENASGLRVRL